LTVVFEPVAEREFDQPPVRPGPKDDRQDEELFDSLYLVESRYTVREFRRGARGFPALMRAGSFAKEKP
jgi:hypothetical protein